VIEGRLAVGTRVPPYKFDCKVKGTTGSYPLIIEISDWDDGWKFIIREKQLKKPAEPVGADQPATKPADKVPAKIQPSTPMSKDGPR
jgi:hypothetical protein